MVTVVGDELQANKTHKTLGGSIGIGVETGEGPSWKLTPEERDEISSSITQTWTDQAIKCFVTQADCANCSIPKGNYSFICKMNKVVPVLLETLGAPDSNRVKKLLPLLDQY